MAFVDGDGDTRWDPVGFAGSGPNLYQYADNNPTNLTDPSGNVSNVTQSGDTVTVTASVTIYGPDATAALAQTWQNNINSVWNNDGNNFAYGKCKVKFNVRVIADSAANHWFTADVAGPAQNYVYVVGDPNFTSETTTAFGVFTIGNWSSGTGGSGFGLGGSDYASHEAGHIFGLSDDYRSGDQLGEITFPNPGHEGHIMAESPPMGYPVQHEINDILAGRACGCH